MQDQTTKKLFPETVSCVRPEPRSYEVHTQSGSIRRRNRRHLRPASTEQVAKSEDEPKNVDSDDAVVPGPETSEPPVLVIALRYTGPGVGVP